MSTLLKERHWDRLGNGGLTFTQLGLGTAPIGNLYRAIDSATARAVLEAAWAGGVRYYDTAPLYGLGLAETRLNSFVREKPRDELVLSTKIGRLLTVCAPGERFGQELQHDIPSRRVTFDYSYDGVMRSIEFSFERLGADRIDIVYAHNLDTYTHGGREQRDRRMEELMQSGYRALVSLRDQKVIKAIGAGVDEVEPAQILAERGDFDLFLIAGTYTLLNQDALPQFLPMCSKRGIGVVLGAPFNSGILATGARPGTYYNYASASPEILQKVSKIEDSCRRRGVKLLDAALQFPLMHRAIVSVVPGAQSVQQMEASIAAMTAPIPAALWSDLQRDGLLPGDAPID